MERRTTLKNIKDLFGNNCIGIEELEKISVALGINLPAKIPKIPFSESLLASKASDHYLILGVSQMSNGEPLTLLSLRNRFGINPELNEPCFYNQDWYLKEKFVQRPLETGWYLLSQAVLDESRAKNPDILEKTFKFPSAVLCAFAFFANWFHNNTILWENDFVWCDDRDHNSDRIYVGKYVDVSGINKNGFSIHRHLSLKNWYGCIESL
jgi:hypothetical protein